MDSINSKELNKIFNDDHPLVSEQGLTITNADGKFIYVNPSFARMLGADQKELIGLTAYDLTYEDEKELTAQLNQRKKGKTGQYKYKVTYKNRTVDIAVTGVPIIKNKTYEGSVAVITDLSRAWNMQSRLKKNEILLEGVSGALQSLLMENNFDKAINGALTNIGTATNVDRVYIFMNNTEEDGTITINHRFEWCNTGVEPQIDNKELQEIPYDPYFMHWYNPLSKGQEYSGVVREFEAKHEREILEEQGIKSILVLPIFSDNIFWGFVGFDDCMEERRWTNNEKNILSALAASIGSHIERAKSKALVEKQKRFYENILNSLPSDIVVFSPDHKYQFINPVAIKDKKVRSWMIGKDDYQYCEYRGLDTQIADKRRELFENVKRSGTTSSFEEQFEKEDGSEEWVLRKLSPVFNENKQLDMMIGYGLDITERKKAEQKLERSLEMVTHAQQIARLGSWEYNSERDSIEISDEARTMLGFEDKYSLTLDEFIALVDTQDKKKVIDHAKNIFYHKKPYDIEIKVRLSNTDIRFLNIKARPFCQGNQVVKIIGTILDITDKKKAEHEIRSLAKFTEENPLPVLRIRANGEWMYTNPGSEGVKKHITDYFNSHYSAIINELLKSDEVRDEEIKVDDQYFSLTFTPVKEFGYVNIYGKDISSRIRQEKELIKARQTAEESQRLKQKFLANMSHEIRTPMNGVIGVVNLLQDTILDSDQKEYLNILKQSSDHLMMLINDILDVSKLESGKNKLINKPFNLKTLINQIMHQMQPQIEKKSLKWNVSGFIDDKACFEGDPVRIRQILFNLVANAVKFTNKGSVGITYNPLLQSNGHTTFVLEVKDTGIGISEDDHTTIFNAFAQSDSGVEYKYGGTGLGLHIVKELVDQMGGEIDVESSPDNGSTFSVTLTLKQLPLEACENEKEKTMDSNSKVKLKVLVVDDQDMNRFIAGNIVQKYGADIIYANNGKEAINQLDLHPDIDIVLMDMQMPEMDGITATQVIRSCDKSYAQVPILAMTAAVINSEKDRCLNAGMDGYIAKPFEPETVFKLIEQFTTERDHIQATAEKKEADEFAKDDDERNFDLSYLKRISDDNLEFIESMLQTYIDDMPGLIAEIEQAGIKQDAKTVGKLAHKAKSMAAYVGAFELQTMLKKLDQSVEPDPELYQTIPDIRQLAHKIYLQIETELAS